MSHVDFDLYHLAKYLHVTPQDVQRLAERGKLPGRKVAGQWRFSRAEIHHWMEERMGLLEEDELAQVETDLAKSAPPDAAQLLLSQILPVEAIAAPLAARTRNSTIVAMVQLAARTGMLWDADRMIEAVRAREQLQSTAMDNGVALLHPRRPLPNILGQPILAIGISPQGIPFGGSSRLTDVFFLICSTDDRGHLRALARLSRLINNNAFLDSLRSAENADQVKQLFVEYEKQLES